MKSQVFKSLVKEAVKEAIQEELKEILLEAVKSPKQTVVEGKITEGPSMSSNEKRAAFENIMGDMKAQFTSQNVSQPFNPQGAMPGGDLPSGEVNMNQIMGLLNSK